MEIADPTSVVIAAISAVASCAATGFAYLSIKKGQRMNYGVLYIDIMEKYASDEMGESLREIGSLPRLYGNNFAQLWKEAYDKKKKWALQIDYHRRKVKYFYRNLSQLLRYKYVENSFAETICSPKGSLLLEKVVLQLDKKLDLPYDEKEFEHVLKVIHKIHGF